MFCDTLALFWAEMYQRLYRVLQLPYFIALTCTLTGTSTLINDVKIPTKLYCDSFVLIAYHYNVPG